MSKVILPDIQKLEPSISKKVSLSKFTQHLDTILSEINNASICNLSSLFISDYYIVIDFASLNYTIPVNFIKKLNDCKSNKEIRFIIIPIVLSFFDKSSHTNVLIVDNFNQSIELYEPHGIRYSGKELQFDIERHIIHLHNIILDKKIKYSFKNVHAVCPLGLQFRQSKVSRDSGHCVAWSLFFINVKLLNLSMNSEEIIHNLNEFSDIELDLLIKKYITLIENETERENKIHTNIYYQLKLSEKEEANIKMLIKEKINKYLEYLDNNQLKRHHNGEPISFSFDTVSKLFNKFIIYSKFSFFHELYFKTIEDYKLKKI